MPPDALLLSLRCFCRSGFLFVLLLHSPSSLAQLKVKTSDPELLQFFKRPDKEVKLKGKNELWRSVLDEPLPSLRSF